MKSHQKKEENGRNKITNYRSKIKRKGNRKSGKESINQTIIFFTKLKYEG